MKNKNGKANWVCITEGSESRLKSTYIFSNSWQHCSVLNRARVGWKVTSERFIDSNVLFGCVKMGWGVLSYKSAPVDQAWMEKAMSFRNRLEMKRDVFQIKNWQALLTAPYLGGKVGTGVIDTSRILSLLGCGREKTGGKPILRRILAQL